MECFFIVVALWVFSVCLHEFGHALTAYYGGDHTVKEKGYLTMNPLHYTHPVLSLLLPVVFLLMGGIGLPGGAVYIERHLLRSRVWETGVSLAGPAMNVILVLLIALGFATGLVKNDPESLASVSLAFLLLLQVSAIFLNLIPVPPLDGFQAIAPWLPEDVRERAMGISGFGLLIVFGALWMVKPLGYAFWKLIGSVIYLLGVNPSLAADGYRAFRFWD
jgi:Zn-dependent protease